MSWLQRIKTSQLRPIEEIIMSVIRKQIDPNKAVQEIMQTGAGMEACDKVQTMVFTYPQAGVALRKMQELLNCGQPQDPLQPIAPQNRPNHVVEDEAQEFQEPSSTEIGG